MSNKIRHSPNASGESVNSGGLLFFVVLGALGIGSFVLWSQFHAQIVTAYGLLRSVELFPLTLLGISPFSDWVTFFRESDAGLVPFGLLSESSLWANGLGLMLFVLPLAIYISRQSIKTNPYNERRFAKPDDYTPATFIEEMGAQNPHLRLIKKLDLINKPINSGKYRLADTVKQYAIAHDLVDAVGDTYAVNKAKAARLMAKQLGKQWTGIGALTIYEYAVMAIYMPRVVALDSSLPDEEFKSAIDLSDNLLLILWQQAADTYDTTKDTLAIDIEPLRTSFDRYFKHSAVQNILSRHAYVATIIYHLIGKAREIGVAPPADVRWLRVVDRRLWLIVNTVGRLTPFTETAGVHAHYMAEIRFKRAQERPIVDAAGVKLAGEFDKFLLTDDEVVTIEANLAKRASGSNRAMKFGSQPDDQMLFLGVRIAENRKTGETSLVEACITDSNGRFILPVTQCKPSFVLSPEEERSLDIKQVNLSHMQEAQLLADQIRKHCARQIVYGFDIESILAVIPGLDRAANQLHCAANIFANARVNSKVIAEAVQNIQPASRVSRRTLALQKASQTLKVKVSPVFTSANEANLTVAIWAMQQQQAVERRQRVDAQEIVESNGYAH